MEQICSTSNLINIQGMSVCMCKKTHYQQTCMQNASKRGRESIEGKKNVNVPCEKDFHYYIINTTWGRFLRSALAHFFGHTWKGLNLCRVHMIGCFLSISFRLGLSNSMTFEPCMGCINLLFILLVANLNLFTVQVWEHFFANFMGLWISRKGYLTSSLVHSTSL